MTSGGDPIVFRVRDQASLEALVVDLVVSDVGVVRVLAACVDIELDASVPEGWAWICKPGRAEPLGSARLGVAESEGDPQPPQHEAVHGGCAVLLGAVASALGLAVGLAVAAVTT